MTRQYQSSLRNQQARQTRLAIIEAAKELFLDQGYGATSVRQIAARAGVSERTVYVAFDDKPSLLNAIADHAMYGATQPGEGQAEFFQEVADIPESQGRLRMLVRQWVAGLDQGLAALGRMVSAAAISDPRLQTSVDELLERRHDDVRTCAEVVLGHPLPRDAPHERMVDELEVLTSEEAYWILVAERGWSLATYEQYVLDRFVETLERFGHG